MILMFVMNIIYVEHVPNTTPRSPPPSSTPPSLLLLLLIQGKIILMFLHKTFRERQGAYNPLSYFNACCNTIFVEECMN